MGTTSRSWSLGPGTGWDAVWPVTEAKAEQSLLTTRPGCSAASRQPSKSQLGIQTPCFTEGLQLCGAIFPRGPFQSEARSGETMPPGACVQYGDICVHM